jgi:uncharacterized protein (TIGR03086 family)
MPTKPVALNSLAHLIDLDLRALDERAVRASIPVVRQVRPEHLGRPTPCSEWNLRDLLAHMTVQHRGFRAAALGLGADLQQWTPPAVPDADPVAAYVAAAQAVLTTFAADGVLERRFALPEISTAFDFPAAQAISFHFIDYVVHGWDVARSLGADYELDDDLAPAALRVAEAVPTGPARELPSAAFGPVRPGEPSAPPLERILRRLGRSPNWPDPA